MSKVHLRTGLAGRSLLHGCDETEGDLSWAIIPTPIVDAACRNVKPETSGTRRGFRSGRDVLRWAARSGSARGLVDTPNGVARAWKDYCEGLLAKIGHASGADVREVWRAMTQLVLLQGHSVPFPLRTHMAPIIGKASIAYIRPTGGWPFPNAWAPRASGLRPGGLASCRTAL